MPTLSRRPPYSMTARAGTASTHCRSGEVPTTCMSGIQACADFDAQRQCLVGHVERVIYNRYKVTIAGPVPVQSASGETKLQFRIEGEIDPTAVRSRSRTIRAKDGGRKEWKGPEAINPSRQRTSAVSGSVQTALAGATVEPPNRDDWPIGGGLFKQLGIAAEVWTAFRETSLAIVPRNSVILGLVGQGKTRGVQAACRLSPGRFHPVKVPPKWPNRPTSPIRIR